MFRFAISLGFGMMLGMSAHAQVVKFGELKSPTKLSGDDLRIIAEGADVTDNAATGSVRKWENGKDGKFNAVSTNYAKPGSRGTRAIGTWSIDDKGRYCVVLEWNTAVEKWCRFVFRAGDKLYTSATDVNPEGKAYEIEFKK